MVVEPANLQNNPRFLGQSVEQSSQKSAEGSWQVLEGFDLNERGSLPMRLAPRWWDLSAVSNGGCSRFPFTRCGMQCGFQLSPSRIACVPLPSAFVRSEPRKVV